MARKSGTKKKPYSKVKPQNGFEDFDDYRDDDDDDLEGDYADENGYSTRSLRSQYVRPRDYRERRCYTLMNNCCWMICGILVALAIGAGGYAYMNGYIAVNVPGLNNGSSNGDGDGDGNIPNTPTPIPLPEGEDSTESNEANGWFEDTPAKATSLPREKPTHRPTPEPLDFRGAPVSSHNDITSANQDGLNEHKPGTKGGWFEDDPGDKTPAVPVSSPITKKPSVVVALHPPTKKETEAPSGMPVASGFETEAPTKAYTKAPSASPTETTTLSPTNGATVVATEAGSTALPTSGATTAGPTQQATEVSTTSNPTLLTLTPTEAATTMFPTSVPTKAATTGVPSSTPTVAATTSSPTEGPTMAPTVSPAPTTTPKGGWFEEDLPKKTPAPKVTRTSSPTSSPLVDSKVDSSTTIVATAQQLLPTDMVPYQYQPRRGIPLSGLEKSLLAQKWGSWKFTDKKKADRPDTDYCGAFPNRDIPWEQFPDNAWQTDPDYVDGFLSQGKDLVLRAMEVHLAEYGFGPDDMPEESFLDRSYKSPFRMEIRDKWDDEAGRRELSGGVDDYSGWMTQQSFDGLVRRLLHAVVSGDSFNLVMGGHSAAAGHGNHFQQSYTLQIQKIMEPVFARLGVKHYSRNTGMGGLGTVQSAMGAQDIYGRDVDILIWDSGMTESNDSPDFDLFARQGLLGSVRAPVLWAGSDDKHVYPALQDAADVDYIMYGKGLGPIPAITDPTTVDEIPWAARYLKCDPDWKSLCEENKYNGTCWIDRPDGFEPPTPQNDVPGGAASWHDGNRMHQLYGRTMSFTILRALYEAIDMWDQQPDKKLTDDMWHVTDYYENIRNKVANLDPDVGTCGDIEARLPTVFCNTPFQARTEFTPRANPEETSLRSIMKPAGPDKTLPQPPQNIYDAPDVYIPMLGVPEGEIDYLAIIENGNDFLTFQAPANPLPLGAVEETGNLLVELTVDDKGEPIVPGLGWGVSTKASPQFCNGTYDSFCGRGADKDCLLYGHNDFRGGITFDSYSGWGIFTLRNLKEGRIFVKMDSWRKEGQNPVTEGWTSINNAGRTRDLSAMARTEGGGLRRNLEDTEDKKEDSATNFCPDMVLEFAYGGTVIRLGASEILEERHSLVQRVVQVWTVLDDPDFTNTPLDIELGIRILGCGREHVFWVTHIYWA